MRIFGAPCPLREWPQSEGIPTPWGAAPNPAFATWQPPGMINPSPAAAHSVGSLRSVKWLSRHKRPANCAAHLFHGPLDSSALHFEDVASVTPTLFPSPKPFRYAVTTVGGSLLRNEIDRSRQWQKQQHKDKRNIGHAALTQAMTDLSPFRASPDRGGAGVDSLWPSYGSCGQRSPNPALPTLAHSLPTPAPNIRSASLNTPFGPDALRLPKSFLISRSKKPTHASLGYREPLTSGVPLRDQSPGGLRFNVRPNALFPIRKPFRYAVTTVGESLLRNEINKE